MAINGIGGGEPRTTDLEALRKEISENAGIKERSKHDTLDKDDFLKLLLTQLSHQDPLQPMEDREFIAQMAQFSSLEQMTNLNREFSRVAGAIALGQAISLIGKTVDVTVTTKTSDGKDEFSTITGRVQEVAGGASPQLLINEKYYDYTALSRVKE
jgi:flagellar basal-body rod modification protein FlgD